MASSLMIFLLYVFTIFFIPIIILVLYTGWYEATKKKNKIFNLSETFYRR